MFTSFLPTPALDECPKSSGHTAFPPTVIQISGYANAGIGDYSGQIDDQTAKHTCLSPILEYRTSLYFVFEGGVMLRWALGFFIVALIAAAFGFLGIASAAVGIARILFYFFLILFLISLVGGLTRRT